ncbi:MAG TPA: hypothetical protein VGP18_12465 [Solirubrobacteraceae bacterium]|nr:hypothetical protein [Solirubrobacteraceae bacterium]
MAFGAVASGRLDDPSRRGLSARSVTAALGVGLVAVVLCGCESTQERSAELQRQAKHDVLATQSAAVTKESPSVKVLQSTVIHSSSATAVVVALRNTSTHTLENAPIEVTVRDAHGSILYQNNGSGLEPSLTTVSLLLPGQETIWVDDQATASGAPATASALVGEGTQASGNIPQLGVTGTHLSAEAGAEATLSGGVANRSQAAQQNLVVYAVARRGVKIVAAGRAVLPEVPAKGTNVPFQIYFVGDPSRAQIQTSAPATTF